MNIIEKQLRDNIKDLNTVFVFPTQTAADLWADRIITISEVTAVAMERFVAWDTFKGKSIKSKQQDKTSIPSAMRQIFATNIISQNAESPFLENLITPEYAKTAQGFANWICSLLPSLSNWKNYFDKTSNPPDSQDKDLLKLYELYSSFLNTNGFFDPAWETPPFEADGHKYIIFFPEILSDYFEYEKILRSTPDIQIINLPEELSDSVYKSEAKMFINSRVEIKNIVKHIKEIHENPENPIDWTDIAINVPDMETYGAYISRELTISEIPHVMRNATPLSSTGAGSLFDLIKNCYSSDFSYDSIKNFVLNSELPWKQGPAIRQLISFGQENHCICGFEYGGQNIDVWEKSFAENPKEELAATLYRAIKKSVQKMANAKTFAELHKTYFEFREILFDMELCSKTSDLILSRCISELSTLIDLEEKYPEICKVASPLTFFTNYISEVSYLEQTDDIGVHIYSYRTAATAPFACHIIVDSSQTGLSVVWEQLTFLQEDKRLKLLGREAPNVTKQFISLYAMNSYASPAYFTVAQKTFDNYSQANSYLTEVDLSKETDSKVLFGQNSYLQERNWFLQISSEFPQKITENQQNSAKNWIFKQNFENSEENSEKSRDYILSLIHNKKLSISKTQLNIFQNCPRAWVFEKVLYISEENNIATLMDQYQTGSLNHKVFELFCSELKKRNLPVHVEEAQLTPEYKEILNQSITDAINNKVENPFLTRELLNTTRESFEEKIIPAITDFCCTFDGCLVLENETDYLYEDPEKSYSCFGRIDCLLKDPGSGETILLDFKSSNSGIPNQLIYDAESTEKPGAQMPMYVYTMRNSPQNTLVDNAAYYNIKDHKTVYVFGEFLAEKLSVKAEKVVLPEAFESTIDYIVQQLDDMAEYITSDKVLNPPEDIDYKICAACAHKAICRKTFNVGKKW